MPAMQEMGIPGSGRSPGVGNGNPLQFSCLGNSMYRGAWRATVHGFAESDTIEWAQAHTHIVEVRFPHFRSESVKSLSWVQALYDPMDCTPPGSSVHGDSPGKNTGVGCHSLLQGIFPTRGSNSCLLHCRQILYCLNQQESKLKLPGKL